MRLDQIRWAKKKQIDREDRQDRQERQNGQDRKQQIDRDMNEWMAGQMDRQIDNQR